MMKPIDILRKGVDHWNHWKSENQIEMIVLEDVDLSQWDISTANLSYMQLKNCKFTQANLNYVDFSESIIEQTDFSGAELSFALFRGSQLMRVNFFRAEMYESIFFQTVITASNFNHTFLDSSAFSMSILHECENLEHVFVGSRCSIDFNTLKNSTDLPKKFLLKMGFTDSQIRTFSDIIGKEEIQRYPVFLSHASVNKDFCEPLYDQLSEQGVKIWYDDKMLRAGDFIRDEIHTGVSLYDKMLLVCSKESLNSDWVEREINRYEEKERAYRKQHGEKISLILPIAIDDEAFNLTNPLVPDLKRRKIEDFRHWRDELEYKKAFEKLMTALNVNPGGVDPISYLKK